MYILFSGPRHYKGWLVPRICIVFTYKGLTTLKSERRKNWTSKEKEVIRKLYKENVSERQIDRNFKRFTKAIYNIMKTHRAKVTKPRRGVKQNYHHPFSALRFAKHPRAAPVPVSYETCTLHRSRYGACSTYCETHKISFTVPFEGLRKFPVDTSKSTWMDANGITLEWFALALHHIFWWETVLSW